MKREIHLSDVTKEILKILRYAAPFFLAIIYWEIICLFLIHDSAAVFKFNFLLFAPAQSLFCAVFCGFSENKLLNRILSGFFMTLLFAFYISQIIYFKIFGSLFSVSMIGLGGDALTNFGWTTVDIIKTSVVWVIIAILPLAAHITLLCVLKPEYTGYRLWLHGAALGATAVFWVLAVLALMLGGTGEHTAYNCYRSSYVDTDTAANQIGVFTNSLVEASRYYLGTDSEDNQDLVIADKEEVEEIIEEDEKPADKTVDTSPNVIGELDFEATAESVRNKDIKALCTYFESKSGTNKNEYTGLFKGYNLIYICAESFSSMAVDEDITPTLYKMANGGIILNNYYNSYKNTTTNGEFSFITGLWPDVSRKADAGSSAGSMAKSATKYMPFGLGTLMENDGAESFAFHNYLGEYYNRSNSWPNLGYTCKFMNDGMTFSSKWPSSDLELMEQSVDDYINEDRFNVYYMTFSGHGPYSEQNSIARKNIKTVTKLAEGKGYSEEALYYLACNYELEKAMNYLLTKLEAAGKLENTVIVMSGDHYPYYLEASAAKSILGYNADRNFDYYKSTCIMYCAGLEQPIECDEYCCNIDILPTVLNLFDIEYDSRLLPGTDVFSSSLHMAVLYNKNFITDKVKYNASTGEAIWADDCTFSEGQKQNYTDYVYSLVKSRYTASLKVMNTDFFKYAWEASGLKPTEDN